MADTETDTETEVKSEPDVIVHNEGTIILFQPLTCAATDWIVDNIPDEAQWFGPSLVVEHRCAMDIALGMLADGLHVV